jgi:N-acetylneuraminic acid mutarotase
MQIKFDSLSTLAHRRFSTRFSVARKLISQSGFFSLRLLIALFLCVGACLIAARTLPAFIHGERPAKISQRTLTFAQRVAYQRAIEDVYWRHRIWPKERPDPKPSLDAVMAQAQLEKKVSDYLRKSQALEDYWQRPITAEQLQAEMERMATHTKKPEVLRELFAALGNDAFVIAECLARPALVERLLTNWYSYDQRIHGVLEQRAKSELQAHNTAGGMKQLSGTYSEVEFVKSDSEEIAGQPPRFPNKQLPGGAPALQRQDSTRTVTLNGREWTKIVQKLAATFSDRPNAQRRNNGTAYADDTLQTGKVIPLQEDASRHYAVAVLERSENRLKLATVEWLKEPLESWLAQAEKQVPVAMTIPQANYTLPTVSDGGSCNENTWTATAAAPEARDSHTAVWTGSEMIIWGGRSSNSPLDSGGRYDPATDTWTFTNSSGAPSARANHTGVWAGTEMIVWGGEAAGFPSRVNTGGKYNPATNTWAPTSTTNAPDGRSLHTAVLAGSEMIVWGGVDDFFNDLNTGGRYNAGTDSWTVTTTSNAPAARRSHTAVWTGTEMIVWGGFDDFNFVNLNTGGRYNPNTNAWSATSTNNVPQARENHTAVWTGTEMIVWGGFNEEFFEALNTGGRYNPNTDSWTATSTFAPDPRELHTAVWTGSEMIVWGGRDFSPFDTGGRYNPGTNSWTGTSTTNVPEARSSHTAVWTGTEMIVWGGTGGFPFSGDLNTGGRYDPASNSWIPTNTYNVPAPRSSHTAVWTGSEMVVWGGISQDIFSSLLNSGGRYDPATNSWTATNMTDAPSARNLHTAVWTGSEMIVWGGTGDFINFNSGGRYNPGTDSWTAMTSIAPYPRFLHTAVWTGTQMIIWGGNSDVGLLDTGGRYNPNTDTWTATSTTNSPAARENHTAVWTGGQMIVWGGEDNSSTRLNTGGRYDPTANSWTATSTTNAPSGREFHTAVWTTSEMIIWGGQDNDFPFPRAGGKYNPVTNSWIATTDIAPDGRIHHSAVWTGTQMIVWGGTSDFEDLNTGGQYIPGTDSWTTTSTTDAPSARQSHTALWTGSDTGSQMIVWGGSANGAVVNTGGRYCAGGAPIPSPTPTATATPRPTPTPRGTPEPRPRPSPPPHP